MQMRPFNSAFLASLHVGSAHGACSRATDGARRMLSGRHDGVIALWVGRLPARQTNAASSRSKSRAERHRAASVGRRRGRVGLHRDRFRLLDRPACRTICDIRAREFERGQSRPRASCVVCLKSTNIWHSGRRPTSIQQKTCGGRARRDASGIGQRQFTDPSLRSSLCSRGSTAIQARRARLDLQTSAK
jgi:hypothetical protein